jgi:hypothetical protein
VEKPNPKRNGNQEGEDGNDKKEDGDKKKADVKDIKEGTGKKQVKCFKCDGDRYISQCPE